MHLNSPNRRMRTRMSGGVGGEEPGSPALPYPDWLRKAEKLAELEPQDGSLWHAYRRGWATARKHLPDVDVAASGGWSDTTSLKRAYQHADSDTMLSVPKEPRSQTPEMA